MYKIAVNGSNGFLGKALVNSLRESGHAVICIPRDLYFEVELLENYLLDSDVVVNLAGESIIGLWTKRKRSKIYNSRIKVTKALVNVINRGNTNIKKVISASAIGIYKSDVLSNELSEVDLTSFLSRVCIDWEGQVRQILPPVKVCIARVGVVLGNDGGIVKRLNDSIWTRIGVIFGKGNQNMPVIHVDDVCRAFNHLILGNDVSGVFNLVCPDRISNEEYTRYFGSLVNLKVYVKIPRWLLRLVLGEFSRVFTDSHIIEPHQLLNTGFVFKYPLAREIVDDCYNRKTVIKL